MSKRHSPLRALVCGLAIAILGVSAVDGGQDTSWANEAHRFHASKYALGALIFVAELNTEVTRVSFETNSEVGLVTNYGSAVCPIRGATRLEALRAAGRAGIEPEIRRLLPVADIDGDGFVSDEEGKTFGLLVWFGQALNYFMTGPSRSRAEISRLMRLSPAEFEAQLHEYRAFFDRASTLGITFVASPSAELLTQSAPPN